MTNVKEREGKGMVSVDSTHRFILAVIISFYQGCGSSSSQMVSFKLVEMGVDDRSLSFRVDGARRYVEVAGVRSGSEGDQPNDSEKVFRTGDTLILAVDGEGYIVFEQKRVVDGMVGQGARLQTSMPRSGEVRIYKNSYAGLVEVVSAAGEVLYTVYIRAM